MGMFDTIQVHPDVIKSISFFPPTDEQLVGGKIYPNTKWQTKNLENMLESYKIDKAGCLLKWVNNEWLSQIKVDMILNFYTSDVNRVWWEFNTKLVKGKIVYIARVPDTSCFIHWGNKYEIQRKRQPGKVFPFPKELIEGGRFHFGEEQLVYTAILTALAEEFSPERFWVVGLYKNVKVLFENGRYFEIDRSQYSLEGNTLIHTLRL